MFEDVVESITKRNNKNLIKFQSMSTHWSKDASDNDFFYFLMSGEMLSNPKWKLMIWRVYKPLLTFELKKELIEAGNIFIDEKTGQEISWDLMDEEINSPKMVEKRMQIEEEIKISEIAYWKSVAESAWTKCEELADAVQEEKDRMIKMRNELCAECYDRTNKIDGYEVY